MVVQYVNDDVCVCVQTHTYTRVCIQYVFQAVCDAARERERERERERGLTKGVRGGAAKPTQLGKNIDVYLCSVV